MPMTAASVAQRRMALKASIRDNEGGPSALVSSEFSRGAWLSKHARARQGNVSRKMLTDNVCCAPSNGNDMLCNVMERGFRIHTGNTSDGHQGTPQGGDQAPLAAIARVSAAKAETWSLVLCLRM